MSSADNLGDLNTNPEEEVPDTRTSYYNHLRSTSLDSASGLLNPRYDLISFLATVQWREIDCLPITWQPALDSIGRGATAEIRQSLVNIQMSFAFKRPIIRDGTQNESVIYQALISE